MNIEDLAEEEILERNLVDYNPRSQFVYKDGNHAGLTLAKIETLYAVFLEMPDGLLYTLTTHDDESGARKGYDAFFTKLRQGVKFQLDTKNEKAELLLPGWENL